MSYQTDLSIQIGGAKFKNPIMPASGAYDYFDNNADVFPMSELGAVMVKSVHRYPREGNPPPRIVEVCGGMINAVGIPSVGIEAFMEKELPKYAKLGAPVVLSISGGCVDHYCQSLEIVANDPRIAAIEMNLSCPNVGTGLPFSTNTVLLQETVSSARSKTELPLFVKLSPNVTDICETAHISEDCGADAVTLSNTFHGMTIDINKKKPSLGNISGGMSGPAIKPLNMYLVWRASTVLTVPIIACGGVSCWQDVVEYIMAGATAVQVGCTNFVNPLCMKEVIDGLDSFMATNGYRSIADIRGVAHG